MSLASAKLPATATAPEDRGLALLRLPVQADKHCRLTPQALAALIESIGLLSNHEDTAVLVLLGGGRSFCLGADLDMLRSADAQAAEDYLRLGQSAMAALAAAPVPVVAAVGGLALGGGFELALACDLRWAHRRAVFALPEATAGLVPAWGGAAALARELPSAIAWEVLAGERVGAARAQALGLVGRVFDGRDFETQVLEAARGLTALGRGACAGLKAVWRAARAGAAMAAERERAICLERLADMRGAS